MLKRWKEKLYHLWYLACMSPQKREWRKNLIRLGKVLEESKKTTVIKDYEKK